MVHAHAFDRNGFGERGISAKYSGAHTLINRIAKPEEVAAVAAFLCLPAASYITGQTIAADSGFLAQGL